MARPDPPLAPGALIGAFRIVRFIARGGMGEVYEAENTITGTRRALKVVRTDLLGDAEMRARFVRETALASRIKHPNVVEAWDPMLESGSVVLPMELLEGESLAQRLRRTGPLDIDEALGIAAAIASGVAAFHERGVIHRDLKPGNVFLARTPGGVVPKVLDFGAARVLGDEHHTITGHVVGSPAYMAPEQAMAARDLDARVDVYALGVILYAMLTGRRPYESDEHGSAIAKLIQRRAYTPLEVLRSSVDDLTRMLVARALAWDREARWSTMREFAGALHAALASREGGPLRDSLTARFTAPAGGGAERTHVMQARPPLDSVAVAFAHAAAARDPADAMSARSSEPLSDAGEPSSHTPNAPSLHAASAASLHAASAPFSHPASAPSSRTAPSHAPSAPSLHATSASSLHAASAPSHATGTPSSHATGTPSSHATGAPSSHAMSAPVGGQSASASLGPSDTSSSASHISARLAEASLARSRWLLIGLAAAGVAGILVPGALALVFHSGAPSDSSPPSAPISFDAATRATPDAGTEAGSIEDAGASAAIERPDARSRRPGGRPHRPRGLWLDPEPPSP